MTVPVRASLFRADGAIAWVNPEPLGGARAPSLTKGFRKTLLLRVPGLCLAWQLLEDVPPPVGTHSIGTISDLHSGCDSVLPCHHRMSSESKMLLDPVCQGSCWLLRDAEVAAKTLAAVFIGRFAAVSVNWPARSPLLRLPEAVLTLLSLGLSSFSLNLCGHLLCLILKRGSAAELSHTPWTVLTPGFCHWLYARHPKPSPWVRAHLTPAAHSAHFLRSIRRASLGASSYSFIA